MKNILMIIAAIVLSGCQSTSKLSINPTPGDATRLIVNISNVTSEEGQLLVMIHDNSADYHADLNINDPKAQHFLKKVVAPVAPNTVVVFENIPAGKYAINVIHDKDADGELDRMIFPFLGMPSEPYALSNNIYDHFSKGDFDDALVELQAPSSQIDLTLGTHLSKVTGL
ncbi:MULTISPECIES: DUF2141 domain-containing protein [Pseudoalteromonas]|uniref:DUF2141 domain-containing protein n=1 Tax=Pseudoalteromonas amylolytica TaxID=1859457 RepID=A0A1S1MTH5_9GAMM|nr:MULTISPECIES: DUF2141 domain-containing protein [Pseudoalteromonas]MCF6436897.1 DUF2141 domain-containing protein [Pseudoalteromonas sp. MMG022]OHU85021.1 hypothetical protein BFC16_20255 [Pseudoalteromonas sp. JW3]OHU90028.1 hypothetical protein BET10_14720 [Pseudoalteromonas amylolytica]